MPLSKPTGALAIIKRQKTKTLAALVRSVKARRRMHKLVPHEEQFAAAVALTIIAERRKRK